ncbi:MAG: tetratricopeptide repeat protein [Pirellulaceae bacterium]|nr:tetratricopeptide repeat protein [Pirellulaceae bacterium]
MNQADQHDELITRGVALHEARKYGEALLVLERAFAATPDCVAARYNLANTLHMLGRNAHAVALFKTIVDTDDDVFVAGCPLKEDPTCFKLDTWFMLFVTTLYDTEDWDLAYPFAQRHLAARTAESDSLWSDEQIQSQLDELRLEYDD